MKEICNGKINSSGFCEKCYEVSQTTSGYCSRLVDVAPHPEPPKDRQSKEEILARKRFLIRDGIEWVSFSGAKDAMQEYAEQYHKDQMREELIKFFAWQNTLTIDETERVIDNYLKDK